MRSAAPASKPPSAATLRALNVLAGGEVELRAFSEAMWPDADHGATSRVGARGGHAQGAQMLRVGAARLAALVGDGWAVWRDVGRGSATRRRWSLTEMGRRAIGR